MQIVRVLFQKKQVVDVNSCVFTLDKMIYLVLVRSLPKDTS